MAGQTTFARLFLGHLDDARRQALAGLGDLEERLRRCVGAARAAWPQLALSTEAFLPEVAARLPAELPAGTLLDDARAADLFLATACGVGDTQAMAAFEADLFPEIDAALRSMELRASMIDEVKQLLRIELFVHEPERRALITQYAARGSLRGWLRSVAVRKAMRLKHQEKRVGSLEDEAMLAVPSGQGGPELEHFRRGYGAAFKAAFSAALTALPPRERGLLRQHFLDGLNIDELGRLHCVHRATVARWIVGARAALLEHIRAHMRQATGVASVRELDSLLKLVRSQTSLSIRRLLTGDEPAHES